MTKQSTRTFTVGLAAAALMAPVAVGAATSATAAPAGGAAQAAQNAQSAQAAQPQSSLAARRAAPKAPKYQYVDITPRGLAADVSTTAAYDVSERGEVAGYVNNGEASPRTFVGGVGRSRWLPAVETKGVNAHAMTIGPSGTVAGQFGGVSSDIVTWAGGTPRVLAGDPSAYFGPSVQAVNASGAIAGVGTSYRLSTGFLLWSASGAMTRVQADIAANYGVAGLSDGGVLAGTLYAPNQQTSLPYPRAVVVRGGKVSYLAGVNGTDGTGAADSQSPNGRYIVGRVGVAAYGGGGSPVWLSPTAKPQPLKGAEGFRPVDVNNKGVVAGYKGEDSEKSVFVWSGGRLHAVTSANRLPRGWRISDVTGINDRGDLAVTLRNDAGTTRAAKLAAR